MLRFEKDIAEFALKNKFDFHENLKFHITLTQPLFEKILLNTKAQIEVQSINKMIYTEPRSGYKFILEYEEPIVSD